MDQESETLAQRLTEDPYKVLGLPAGASLAEVKHAYFSLIKVHSPEKDAEGFKRIRAAYDAVRSEERREETDFLLFEESMEEKEFQKSEGAMFHLLDDLIDVELHLLLFPQKTDGHSNS